MSDIIQLLPDTVANQIAAGEVIQRPASVIKELVENAVDAGAKRIDVSVVDAGRTSIQVIDDGCGMSETDARLAFERHATSKIRQANDLFNLHTMGFRGEALPSIAAVAQVELKTKQQGEDIGTDLCMAGSKVVSQEACACPAGSNFMVENLFFNVPARRKFLKSNTTELNNIIAAFERIVLVYPNITFTFHSNGTELYDLRACGLRQRIVDVFGKRINQDLLPVKVETSVCGISGFVGKPESAKKKGAKQFFFVNGRFMRHPYFSKAVMSVYERLVPQGEQVPYFIYFDVDPKDIDVNIHPTKTEIKFENEQAIWQILSAAVRDAVGSFNDVSTIEFDTVDKPDIPVYTQGAQFDMPKVDYNPNYNPFKETSGSGSLGGSTMHQSKLGQDYMDKPVSPKVPDQWDTLYSGLDTQPSPDHTMLFPETPSSDEGLIEEKSPVHYQYKGRFIMTAVKSGLMIIDQHRAHVRILFEDYLRRLKARQMHSQKVLFPQSVDFSAQEIVTLSRLKDDITQLGFELTSLGGNTFSINAIPEGFEGIDITALLHDILSETAEEQSSAIEQVHESLALSLARAAAIPYGEVLNNDEMEKVINGLFQCENVNYTPDGKATLCILKQRDIEQMLG
jgi:DNA mismatch repair protein MutL